MGSLAFIRVYHRNNIEIGNRHSAILFYNTHIAQYFRQNILLDLIHCGQQFQIRQ